MSPVFDLAILVAKAHASFSVSIHILRVKDAANNISSHNTDPCSGSVEYYPSISTSSLYPRFSG